MYWCKFDKATGQITGLSNVKPDEENIFEIDEDTFVKFRTKASERKNYIVKYSVTKKDYVLVPYKDEKTVFDVREIFVEATSDKNSQCLITKNQNGYVVSINVTKEDEILLHPHRLCKFSVTKKHDPHYLIRTFEATVEQITNKHQVSFIDDDEKEDVSIYTPKIFDSYGVINDNV